MDNIALFDMDGSLADYTAALVRDLNGIRNIWETPVTAENIWSLSERGYIHNRIALIKSQPGWWLELQPIQKGMDMLESCRTLGFDIHILTKGPKKHSRAWDEKVQWCQKWVGEDVDIHITSDKGLVYGKVLYDDYPDYMLRWLKHRPRGLGIMPVTPLNKKFSHPNVVMYNGAEDTEKVIRALRIVLDRKPGQDLVL